MEIFCLLSIFSFASLVQFSLPSSSPGCPTIRTSSFQRSSQISSITVSRCIGNVSVTCSVTSTRPSSNVFASPSFKMCCCCSVLVRCSTRCAMERFDGRLRVFFAVNVIDVIHWDICRKHIVFKRRRIRQTIRSNSVLLVFFSCKYWSAYLTEVQDNRNPRRKCRSSGLLVGFLSFFYSITRENEFRQQAMVRIAHGFDPSTSRVARTRAF